MAVSFSGDNAGHVYGAPDAKAKRPHCDAFLCFSLNLVPFGDGSMPVMKDNGNPPVLLSVSAGG